MATRHSNGPALIPAAAYFRMSTNKQEESIPRQRANVRRYAKAHGFEIVREYIDPGISGDKFDVSKRVQFLEMVRASADAEWTHILADDLNRIGRFSTLQMGRYLYPLEDNRVLIKLASDNTTIDLTTQIGRLMLAFQAEAGNDFLNKLGKATHSGKMNKAREGRYFSRIPLGYSKTPDGKIAPNEFAFAIKLAFELYAAGYSTRKIGRRLFDENVRASTGNPLAPAHIKRLLQNPLYHGLYQWNVDRTRRKYAELDEEVRIPNNHPPIVSKALFDRVQDRFKRNRDKTSPGELRTYMFSSLLKCSCGGSMYPTNPPNRQMYYRCKGGLYGMNSCQRSRVAAAEIEPAIVAALADTFQKPAVLKRLRKGLVAEIKRRERSATTGPGDAQKRLRSVRVKLQALEQRLADVDVDMLPVIQDMIRDKRDELRRAKADVEAAQAAAGMTRSGDLETRQQAAVDLLADLPDTLGQLASADQNRILSTLIERVDVAVDILPPIQPKNNHGHVRTRPRQVLAGGTIYLASPIAADLFQLCSQTVQAASNWDFKIRAA